MSNIDPQEFIDANQGLLNDLANKFHLSTSKFSKEDLLQEANLAATKAIKKFDPDKGDAKISTYVYTTVKRSLRDFVRKNKHDLYVTPYQQNQEFLRAKSEGTETNKFTSTAMAGSIDKPLSSSPNSSTVGDIIPSGALSPVDRMIKQEQIDILNQELESLSDREQDILKQRFFDGKQLADIARDQKVTRQRIEQISKRAIGKLKNKIIPRLDGTLFV